MVSPGEIHQPTYVADDGLLMTLRRYDRNIKSGTSDSDILKQHIYAAHFVAQLEPAQRQQLASSRYAQVLVAGVCIAVPVMHAFLRDYLFKRESGFHGESLVVYNILAQLLAGVIIYLSLVISPVVNMENSKHPSFITSGLSFGFVREIAFLGFSSVLEQAAHIYWWNAVPPLILLVASQFKLVFSALFLGFLGVVAQPTTAITAITSIGIFAYLVVRSGTVAQFEISQIAAIVGVFGVVAFAHSVYQSEKKQVSIPANEQYLAMKFVTFVSFAAWGIFKLMRGVDIFHHVSFSGLVYVFMLVANDMVAFLLVKRIDVMFKAIIYAVIIWTQLYIDSAVLPWFTVLTALALTISVISLASSKRDECHLDIVVSEIEDLTLRHPAGKV